MNKHLDRNSFEFDVKWFESLESEINWQTKAFDSHIGWQPRHLTLRSVHNQIHLNLKSTDNQNHLNLKLLDNQPTWISSHFTSKSFESQIN